MSGRLQGEIAVVTGAAVVSAWPRRNGLCQKVRTCSVLR